MRSDVDVAQPDVLRAPRGVAPGPRMLANALRAFSRPGGPACRSRSPVVARRRIGWPCRAESLIVMGGATCHRLDRVRSRVPPAFGPPGGAARALLRSPAEPLRAGAGDGPWLQPRLGRRVGHRPGQASGLGRASRAAWVAPCGLAASVASTPRRLVNRERVGAAASDRPASSRATPVRRPECTRPGACARRSRGAATALARGSDAAT